MFTLRFPAGFVSSAAVLCAVACGGTTPSLNAGPSFTTSSSVRHGASDPTYKVIRGLLFVALGDPYKTYDDVQIYDVHERDPKPLAYIRDGLSEPGSVCIDSKRTVYVTNQYGSGWISKYRIGSTSPTGMITKGIDIPLYCAIDTQGNLWVTNYGGLNVTEYLQGSSLPHRVITNGLTAPVGIAIDRAGNIYVSNHDGSSDANVQVYRPGHMSPSRTITDGVKWPDGIGVDAAGTLYVTNIIPGNLEEYHSGSSKPYRAITQEMNGPIAMTFSPSGWMYVSNFGAQGGGSGPPKTILEFPPGSRKPAKKMITQGLYLPGGTAYYPPALP